ncbi:MAG: hypothetical protein HY093_01080 [Candidatus Liptonbacteria bacterium]|nr:hypothetical protein [Candidatus Liptonbacteria bacterium]
MLKIETRGTVFPVPRVVFTLQGNKASEEVIRELARMNGSGEQDHLIFPDHDSIRRYFEGGVSSQAAVVLFDKSGSGLFTMATASRPEDASSIPRWAQGAHWAVKVHGPDRPATCAKQVRADFRNRFENRLSQGLFPWGKPRNGENPPTSVTLPDSVRETIERLNQGPDLAAMIVDTEMALEIPEGSRISWIRVADAPIVCDSEAMTEIVGALHAFEKACTRMARRPDLEELLSAGVDMPDAPELREVYLHPSEECFSVSRADLHWTGVGLFASEVDEMPGGFAELYHLDRVYTVNQDAWERCIRWLTKPGLLVILVSDEWSKCYVSEMSWLVTKLNERGLAAKIITTTELDQIEVNDEGVFYSPIHFGGRGVRVETIWRQFPIFETSGKLAQIVLAAHARRVRLVPEFGPWGNKAWFSIYWSHRRDFEEMLLPGTMATLDEIIPHSHIITSRESFPFEVVGHGIRSLDELRSLAEAVRDLLVLKVCGANILAARSYGVLMGHGLTDETWRHWIDERIASRQPFIVQRRVPTAVARIAVRNTKRGTDEMFDCRLLVRPWRVDGKLVSASACAVPSNTLRVHGRVDMAILPVVFE